MDRVVQQNAARVGDSTAAAHGLKTATDDLAKMVDRFDIGTEPRRDGRSPSPIRQNPVYAVQDRLVGAVRRAG
jgi:hypothetical protein